MLLLLTVVLTLNLHKLVSTERYHNAVREALNADLAQYPGAYLAEVRYSNTDRLTIVRALVRAPEPFSAEQVGHRCNRICPRCQGWAPVELRVSHVPTTVMSATGPLFSINDTASDGRKE